MRSRREANTGIEAKAVKVGSQGRQRFSLIAIAVFAVAAGQAPLAAQPPRYTVIDLGELGGTFSAPNGINNASQVDGISTLRGNLSMRAFLWGNGVMKDLGTLGGPNSAANGRVNNRAEVAVWSDTAIADPNGEDFCGFGTGLICLPSLWREGVLIPLPTLGGNNAIANEVNNRGQIAGASEIATPDPACQIVLGVKPVIWDNGQVHELPTLPGDSFGKALVINDRGQAAGVSLDCSTVTLHAVLWENGVPTDLGNLGGTVNVPEQINNHGQVVGYSYVSSDTIDHAFLWQDGVMRDLGTLRGDIYSAAFGINEKGQVAGVSFDASGNERPFLWENGVMTDLNTLIPSGSPLFLLEGDAINARGQIAGVAVDIRAHQVHGFLATPCDDETDCERGLGTAPAETLSPKVVVPENVRRWLQRRGGLPGSWRLFARP